MLHLSGGEGTGGTIKSDASSFVVKEITGRGMVLEPGARYAPSDLGEAEVADGRFTTLVLQKREWNTVDALIAVAKRLRRSRRSVGYAGTKDRQSVSVQLASIYGVTPEQVSGLEIKDLSINGAWRSNGVRMGSNLGNAFEIEVSGVERPGNAELIIRELGSRIPNYFDRQRFGSRLNNARIGLAMMSGDFESAAMLLLTDATGETNAAAVEARARLAADGDFAAALGYFPRYLRNERHMLSYLSTNGTDYAGALRRLPRGTALMFIHSVQSLVFNLEVEERLRTMDLDSKVYCGSDFYGFPDSDKPSAERGEFALAALIGYETMDEHISDAERAILERLSITKDSFRMRQMPELGVRGAFRPLLAPVKGLSAKATEGTMRLAFSIPSGTYATVLVNEITRTDGLETGMLWDARS